MTEISKQLIFIIVDNQNMVLSIQKRILFGFVCPLIDKVTVSAVSKFYKDTCEPHLKETRDRLESALDSFARAGKNIQCAKQQFTEAKWYIKARKFSNAIDTFGKLQDGLNSEDLQESATRQDGVGSYGACYNEWFFKVDASLRYMFSYAERKEPLPVYPKFLDQANSPEKLKRIFNYYLNTENGLEYQANAKALNCLVTGFVAMLYADMPLSYHWDKDLKNAMKEILDVWQDKTTGFWGTKKKNDDKEVFHPSLSITFHVVNLSNGDVNLLPQITHTLLSAKSKKQKFLDWCYEEGRFSHHHAYDIAKIFKCAWHRLPPKTQESVRREMASILAYSLRRIMSKNYDFDDPNGDEINESVAYHVFFLEEAGFLKGKNTMWWGGKKRPSSAVVKKLLQKIGTLNAEADPELSRAKKVLKTQ